MKPRIGHIYRLRRGRIGHIYLLRGRYGGEGEAQGREQALGEQR